MDSNRLQLNFGTGGYNNDRNYATSDGNVYPTTPSTFPQPFKNPASKTPTDFHPPTGQSPAGYGGGGGYFMNPSYQPTYGQPQQPVQYQGQYQQQASANPQSSYTQQQRQGGYPPNDPNSGLAHQFSNQNLGSAQRQGNPYVRQPSPSQRPRTGGAQPHYGSLLSPSMPASNNQSQEAVVDEPPEKNPEKYSSNVGKRGQGLHVLVEAFFRENITRARDRNLR
jgi:protein-serine/threonine kinase